MEYSYIPALIPGKIYALSGCGPLYCTDARLPDDLRQTRVLASYHLWNGAALPFGEEMADVFGDSGGFSVVASNAVIDPRNAILWQLGNNCTRGVILDIPPYRFGKQGSTYAGSAADMWRPSLARTVANTRVALPFYRESLDAGRRFRWWGVIHGETYEQLRAWHAAVAEVYPFMGDGEGWALVPKPENDVVAIARHIRAARDLGLRHVHIFKSATPLAVAVMTACAKLAGVQILSNDSATAERNAGYWNVFVPRELDGSFPMRERFHFQGGAAVTARLMEWCDCFSCKLLKIETAEGRAFPRLYYVNRVTLHNFLCMKAVAGRIHAAAESDPDRLLRTVLGRDYGAVMREWEGVTVSDKQFRNVSVFDRLRTIKGSGDAIG